MSQQEHPEPPPAEHLGDGAYISEHRGYVVLTANHHDPANASDAVYLDDSVLRNLVGYLRRHNLGGLSDDG